MQTTSNDLLGENNFSLTQFWVVIACIFLPVAIFSLLCMISDKLFYKPKKLGNTLLVNFNRKLKVDFREIS